MRPREYAASHPHHPWRRFAELTDWSLVWAELPEGVMGRTCHQTRTVTLALGLSQAERRCTIAHETAHIVRGPVAPHQTLREELAIDRSVARLLVPSVPRLVDAMVWADGHLETAADALWVDHYLLSVRLRTLTAAERTLASTRLGPALS
ncbi:hypothetical protein [Nocardioides halotolerans]|jgi:hypothetical protein|uniref:hypothetical protein n=1 Tax=Nocardioides halotolerans TaxID=433660 RepID=UPI00040A2278|nr:hypothetical protein [Nocardioides halotolerans]